MTDTPASVVQILPFPVRVIRWFESREIWTYISGQVLTLGPIILNSLADLGLSPLQLLIWTVVVNVAVSNAGIFLKNQSSGVVGTKTDVAAADAAPAPAAIETPTADPSPL